MIKNLTVGKSPLVNDANVLAVPEPVGGVLDTSEPFNISQQGRWSSEVMRAWEAIRDGKAVAGEVNAWVGRVLDDNGTTLEDVLRWSERDRIRLCNKILRAAKKEMARRDAEMVERIKSTPRDPLAPGGKVEFDGDLLGGLTAERGMLPKSLRSGGSDANRAARTALHVRLRAWALGPLVLERPQGSSLHHLADYDAGNGPTPGDVLRWFEDCQIVLVENDWGRAVPQIEGEWRVPFAFICWEFRISSVRVLAFTEADREPHVMWLCYGADGHWVVDDYRYELGCPALPRGIAKRDVDAYEFRRVAKVCYDTIRASCIMLDAKVAHAAHVSASAKLKERREKQSRSPLRDHYVVRLLHAETRAYNQRARSAGARAGDARAPQRGHWRKGTWVHFDDQDSGQVQYTNDGGFVVSKTWRRWHFAGDPKNIIHKEYRL